MDRATELKQTRGSAALAEKFKPKRSGAQKACSERTRIEQSRLSKLASGEARPRIDELLSIEREEGIPVALWAEPADESELSNTGPDGPRGGE